jgi:hypothetical protein
MGVFVEELRDRKKYFNVIVLADGNSKNLKMTVRISRCNAFVRTGNSRTAYVCNFIHSIIKKISFQLLLTYMMFLGTSPLNYLSVLA